MSGSPFEPYIYPKRPSRDSCHVTLAVQKTGAQTGLLELNSPAMPAQARFCFTDLPYSETALARHCSCILSKYTSWRHVCSNILHAAVYANKVSLESRYPQHVFLLKMHLLCVDRAVNKCLST